MIPMDVVTCHSTSEAETEAIAHHLAQRLTPGSLIALIGEVGTGKTVFARGIIHGLGHPDLYITSPTFTLINTYTQGRLSVYHFDLYRLESTEALLASGAEEYLNGDGVCLVEWPRILLERGVADYLEVLLTAPSYEAMTHRTIQLRPYGPASQRLIQPFLCPPS
ncbi:MAG: tRNA (adenosine(37)-N6)-threonylcarbamoyltransferase complex ATPase subunit type 1 TsaE [Magnetococcales bacterium]|nr:tRNA (adenosine(37)-N6)-threonylcarbamoyltransferase complex ATPase subunit type 1 TsaE [Magnetococcales bacterium]